MSYCFVGVADCAAQAALTAAWQAGAALLMFLIRQARTADLSMAANSAGQRVWIELLQASRTAEFGAACAVAALANVIRQAAARPAMRSGYDKANLQ